MLARNRPWESVILLLVAFTMFRPEYLVDRVSPPFLEVPGPQVV